MVQAGGDANVHRLHAPGHSGARLRVEAHLRELEGDRLIRSDEQGVDAAVVGVKAGGKVDRDQLGTGRDAAAPAQALEDLGQVAGNGAGAARAQQRLDNERGAGEEVV